MKYYFHFQKLNLQGWKWHRYWWVSSRKKTSSEKEIIWSTHWSQRRCLALYVKPFETCYSYSIALNFTLTKCARIKTIFNQIAWIYKTNRSFLWLINSFKNVYLLIELRYQCSMLNLWELKKVDMYLHKILHINNTQNCKRYKPNW